METEKHKHSIEKNLINKQTKKNENMKVTRTNIHVIIFISVYFSNISIESN